MIIMKVCFICFDFKKSNIRRQPWRYIYELCKGVIKVGINLVIISNGEKRNIEMIDGIKVRYVKQLRSIFGESKEVLQVLEEENPDVVVMLFGMTSFLRLSFKIDKPVIGILTSPIYSMGEILRYLGLREIIRHFHHVSVHLLGAVIPKFMIRKWINRFKYIVVLSEENKRRLEKIGISSKILVLPPGVDELYLELPDRKAIEKIREEINPEGTPIIMYFTSPLTLRGTDTLVKAFANVRKEMPSKLVFLSRLEHKELVKEELILKEIARKEGISDSIVFISKLLKPEEVKLYVCAADIICLPFKIVISDVPISLLEAMALGKPVVSTNVNGILDLLKGIIVKPNNPDELAKMIIRLLKDRELANIVGEDARLYMKSYPRWKDIQKKFVSIIEEVFTHEANADMYRRS